MVHFILSHSYIVFLIAVVLGAVLHIAFPVELFTGRVYPYLGFAMIIAGSGLIYWAQATSSASQKDMEKTGKRNFERGPYKYSRNPTHIGLTVMTLGLAFLLNSFFVAIFLIIASIITKFIFLRQEEDLLAKRYGQEYLDYKKKVSTWV
jgi:protein-S-isoprenylcysteine O-methyltransferase Ste14